MHMCVVSQDPRGRAKLLGTLLGREMNDEWGIYDQDGEEQLGSGVSLVLKRNELANCEKTCILPSERSQSERATYSKIPTI